MSITQPAKVPLEHRLREVPQSLRMLVETDTWSSNTPVGHLCHEAAAEIERLRGVIRALLGGTERADLAGPPLPATDVPMSRL